MAPTAWLAVCARLRGELLGAGTELPAGGAMMRAQTIVRGGIAALVRQSEMEVGEAPHEGPGAGGVMQSE